ncbi:hypothetical protein OIO90_003852 [Microbotryomycetes sp. JL221]|nr:hypothetical protein OIO90_003852 [Microbotryomycetes sp. JL221]
MTNVPQSTKDLEQARSLTNFDKTQITRLLNEGYRDSDMRQQVANVISKEPAFDKSKRSYMSRQQRLEKGLEMTKKLFEIVDREDWGYMEYMEALMGIDEPLGLNLHEIAFQPVIQAQGSDEQHEVWMQKCLNHEILGCYMQTELGHGSNVQQLETTATYDKNTQEFVLNSPTISSTKWWIGALGIIATHGVVQARLNIDGKDYGPHLFIVQLRSLEDHSLMPGIEAGEIGPKVHGGMAAVDNGWARFNKVRIPLNQMLNRFSKVSETGQYSKPPHDKIAFGGMVFIRAQMIGNLAWRLAKATTISTRYLHTRRQFADTSLKPGQEGFGVERQVISYPGVYMRVLPQIAKAYVFITIGKDMADLYQSMAAKLVEGDVTLMAETHAVSSGLKSYVSTSVVEGIEIVRRAMGGHGFLDANGVGRIYATELPSVTYEGDNYILHLQVVRAALKTLAAVQNDPNYKLSPSSAYFESVSPTVPTLPIKQLSVQDWLNPSIQLQLISLRAALSVDRIDKLVKNGKQWSELSHECIEVSKSIVEAFLIRRMQQAIDHSDGLLAKDVGQAERKILAQLVHFFILNTLENSLPQLFEFGIIAPTTSPFNSKQTNEGTVENLRQSISNSSKEILPQTIGLTDSFNFSDWELDTVLGRYDGAAYETMLARVKADIDANVGDESARKRMYTEHIKPILERGKRLSHM